MKKNKKDNNNRKMPWRKSKEARRMKNLLRNKRGSLDRLGMLGIGVRLRTKN